MNGCLKVEPWSPKESTPGPFGIRYLGDMILLNSPHRAGQAIASVHRTFGPPLGGISNVISLAEQEANARLFQAAPRMLEILELCAETLGRSRTMDKSLAAESARALIAEVIERS